MQEIQIIMREVQGKSKMGLSLLKPYYLSGVLHMLEQE